MNPSDPADLIVHPDIRRAETLPPRAFVDPAILERELATVFKHAWLRLPDRGDDPRPLDEQVASRGSRVPVSLLGRPLFLQRGWDDDQLRAFPNSCTHAWHPLVLGASRGPTLVCAQHGRRFDCTGKFLSQPGFKGDLPDFPRACDHLPALPVSAWRRLLFASMDPGARPLAQELAELDTSLARMPQVQTRTKSEVREVAGNWKQHAWNYLDQFHISFVHRAPHGLADALDMSSYTVELHDRSVLQWAYAAKAADGFDPAHVPDRFADPTGKGRRVFALWWFVFPNLTLNFYPWGLSVNVYQPVPGRPDATSFLWEHWVMDRAAYDQRESRWLDAQVDAEDVDTLAHVSRGLRSGFAPRGRFAPEDEQAAHWFHLQVSRELLSAR